MEILRQVLQAAVESTRIAAAAFHLDELVAQEQVAQQRALHQVVAKDDIGSVALAVDEFFLEQEGVEGDVAVVGYVEAGPVATDIVESRAGEALRGGLDDAADGVIHESGLQVFDGLYAA